VTTGNTAEKNKQPEISGSGNRAVEPDFLVIGRIVKPHGIYGEVSVKVLTEFPERFDAMETVYLGDETSAQLVAVTGTRWHRERVLVKFAQYDSRDAAETLRGKYLKIPRTEAAPLEPGAFYHYQLEGLTVVTDAGETLGQIAYILETGANDVDVVQTSAGELLIPVTDEVVRDINPEAGVVTVHLLPGLR